MAPNDSGDVGPWREEVGGQDGARGIRWGRLMLAPPEQSQHTPLGRGSEAVTASWGRQKACDGPDQGSGQPAGSCPLPPRLDGAIDVLGSAQ